MQPIGDITPIADSILNITYGDGTNILGSYARTHFGLYSATIHDQVVGIASKVILPGNSTLLPLPGIMGLAYPYLADYTLSNGSIVSYSPVVTSIWTQHLIGAQQFSMALDVDGGTLALGGIPRGVTFDENSWSETPILKNIKNQIGDPNDKVYKYYIIKFGFAFDGADKIPGNDNDHTLNSFRGVVDSGTAWDWVSISG
jgi:hypothetical protein